MALKAGQKIAFIQGGWHGEIVEQARLTFIAGLEKGSISVDSVEIFDVPGSLEIPFMAQELAKSGQYACIVGCGFVVNGGIYRHDFVAQAILDGIMRVQLDTSVPVLSVVLTPHHFHEHDVHDTFFFEHFKKKGKEAAEACLAMLENVQRIEAIRGESLAKAA